MARDVTDEDLNRQQKARAQRIDHTYYQKPHKWRSRMMLLSLLLPLIGGGALAAAFFFPSIGQKLFEPGHVSTKHSMFGMRCADCHEEKNGQFGSVLDTKCLACHDGPVHNNRQSFPHNAALTLQSKAGDGGKELFEIVPVKDAKGNPMNAPSCASCHTEHKGNQHLADIPDNDCNQCHAPAQIPVNDGGAAMYKGGITSFHKGHENWRILEKGDTTPVRFGHKTHMADKVKMKTKDADGKDIERVMTCTDCHVPDAQRAYMKPISYEVHCASCHPVSLEASLGEGDKKAAISLKLLHEQPSIVIPPVKAKVLEYLVTTAGGKPPGVPNPKVIELQAKIKGERKPPVKKKLETELAELIKTEGAEKPYEGGPEKWLRETTDGLMKPLFFPEQKDLATSCIFCHMSKGQHPAATTDDEASKLANATLPVIDDPKIPAVWLQHSKFNHQTHRVMKCEDCHNTSRQSEKTSDLMIPGIKNCQECHKPEGARSGCNECHIYHNKQQTRIDGLLTIDQLLNGLEKK